MTVEQARKTARELTAAVIEVESVATAVERPMPGAAMVGDAS